jgi:outer membrane protein OmpA-like peptidoglycan-associated protein
MSMTAYAKQLTLLLTGLLISATCLAVTVPYIVDGDGDLVSDEIDDCPYTPVGVQVDATGCPLNRNDVDGDGVPDVQDDCPYSPPGAFVDAKGCSLDGDFDGVADGLDRCPGSPLARVVNEMGCAKGERPQAIAAVRSVPKRASVSMASPPAQGTQVVPASVIAQPPQQQAPVLGSSESVAAIAEAPLMVLSFGHDSTRLGAGDMAAIRGYAKVFLRELNANPKAKLRLQAYADRGESEVATLAVARMVAVRNALVQQGIALDRIHAENGVLQDGDAGRNRRVEVRLSP